MALAVALAASLLAIAARVEGSAGDGPVGGGGFCQRVSSHFDAGMVEPTGVPDGAVIGGIDIRVLDVFDETLRSESQLPHRLANRLHVTTRPSVIERELLFESGDRFDPRTIAESERRLRSTTGLYDVCIAPVRVRGGVVDLLVVTRDVWTLGLGAGFSRSGEENTWHVGVEDANFLGTGRLLDLKYSVDPDRTERRFRFQDPALLGTRAQLALKLAERSDGYRYTLDAGRPFFSFDTRWSAFGRGLADRGEVKLYDRGEVAERFQMEQRFLEVRGGLSPGFTGRGAHRFFAGFTWDQRRFETALDAVAPPAVRRLMPGDRSSALDPAPTAPPPDRTLAYPWVGYEWVEDGWVERSNLDQVARTEDWNLGSHLSARLGWSSPAWGGDRDEAVAAVDWSRGLAGTGGRNVLVVQLSGSGRYGDGEARNAIVGAGLRHYFRDLGRHQLLTSLSFDAAESLDPESQLLLGGDSGLRGYPLRYRDGDRRVLATVEQRFYTDLEVLKLFHVGAAVFFDAGRAWYADGRPDQADEWLRDVGVGLRLGSSRSSRGTMVHLDVAFPLDGDSSQRRGVQWLLSTKERF